MERITWKNIGRTNKQKNKKKQTNKKNKQKTNEFVYSFAFYPQNIMDLEAEEFNELDVNWIHEFEKVDSEYKYFYNEDCQSIQIHYIYIDKHKNIENVREDIFFLKDNSISKEEMIRLIKKAAFHNDKKYSVLSILQYNMDMDPADIKPYLKDDVHYDFLKSIKHLSPVSFSKTIHILQDLNDLIFLFYENVHSTTKKVVLHKSGQPHKTRKRIETIIK